MLNFLYSIYSIVGGVFAYVLFSQDVIRALLFLFVLEFIVFLYYHKRNMIWSFKQRFAFAVLYFLGYFSSFLLYQDLKFEKPF